MSGRMSAVRGKDETAAAAWADIAGNELPELSIESGFLPKLKERIRIAREIEKAQHEAKKETHDRNWLIEAAEAMDIDLDASM